MACSVPDPVHWRILQLEAMGRRRSREGSALEVELDAARAVIARLPPAPEPDPDPDPDPTPVPVPVPVPVPAPAPKLRKYDSESSKKRAVRKLRSFLQLYPSESQADLLARAVVVDGRGRKSGLSVGLVKELLRSPRMKYEMKEFAETVLQGARTHMMQAVYSADNFTNARRLLRLSYRKLQWLRRLFSHKGKSKRVMHPEYDTAVPVFPSVPDMKADEADMLAAHGGIDQQDDGRGAVCDDLDRTLCKAIARAHARGELVSTGEGEDVHVFMWAGDGFMARKKSKWVQLGVILSSITVLNQSPNDSNFVMNYEGGEDYDIFNIRSEELRPVLQRLAREGAVRDEHGELPTGVGKCVGFGLGGDKPWLMTMLGRRNMNHTYFSPSCGCTRNNITCLECEGGQDGHYSCDADQMCRDSQVCPNVWLRGGGRAVQVRVLRSLREAVRQFGGCGGRGGVDARERTGGVCDVECCILAGAWWPLLEFRAASAVHVDLE